MRIAFFVDVFPRISNTFILNQITGLIDRGHEVDIFALSEGDFTDAQEDVARYRLQGRMRHLPIPAGWLRRSIEGGLLLLDRQMWRRSTFQALNFVQHGRSALALERLFTTASFLRGAEYDVVHCQFGKLGPWLVPLAREGALRGKLVTSFRGADITSWLSRYPRMYDELFEVGDHFLPVSDNFRRRLIEVGCDPAKIEVHHSGIHVDRFEFRHRSAPESGPVELLFVGRLTEKKGVADALSAVAKVVSSGADVRFTLVGDGPLEEALRDQAGRSGIAERVEFAGSLPQSRVAQTMLRSHLLLAPSVTASSGDQEGIPNVVKEAMATGMPVLSTLHSGIPELVEDGVSGFLVPERDPDALAERLHFLLDHPERWAQMGRSGRQKVERDYDIERLNDELEELYGRPRGRGTRDAPAAAPEPASAR